MDTLFPYWNNRFVINLNDLRVFELVRDLRSFSAAARALGLPESSVSRSIAKLELEVAGRLFERTTRQVVLTPTGMSLHEQCAHLLDRLEDGVSHVRQMNGRAGGTLRVGAGVGFGINVIAEQLPAFLARYPDVNVSLDLTSGRGSPVNDGLDVAIRIGPLPDSGLRQVHLGSMERYLCAAPAYLRKRGTPEQISDLASHDTIEMPRGDGRPRQWTFDQEGTSQTVTLRPRVVVNEALTAFRLVLNGAGLGVASAYLCAPELRAGRLVRLFPDWRLPALDVNLVFAGGSPLSLAAQAFIDYMRDSNRPGQLWRANDPLETWA